MSDRIQQVRGAPMYYAAWIGGVEAMLADFRVFVAQGTCTKEEWSKIMQRLSNYGLLDFFGAPWLDVDPNLDDLHEAMLGYPP